MFGFLLSLVEVAFVNILGKASEVTPNEVYAFASFKVADGDR